jgi:hypothetical protein
MNLMSRLEKLEAELESDRPQRGPVDVVVYSVSYGDDVKAKRAEAEAEFRRRNPDWQGPLDGRDGQVCLIELVSVAAENGRPKHPDWQPYLAALKEPDRPENAQAIAAYEAAIRPTLQ